jgi:CRISPR-associated protein Csb2
MQLVLQQSFPLGRFHATPWQINPFDDPHGEWPPSPWRLVRAIVARWYQWRREIGETWPTEELDSLILALCTSTYSFNLPEQARKCVILRQYHPAEFSMDPPNYKSFEAAFAITNDELTDELKQKIKNIANEIEQLESRLLVRVKKKRAQKSVEEVIGKPVDGWHGISPDPGVRGYGTSLIQDNAWCIPPDADLFWFIEGDAWSRNLLDILDHCLERIVYFGRAEALTQIHRVAEGPGPANVKLTEGDSAGDAVPVLVPSPDAQRADIERVTQDPRAARNIPEGARLLYARRPPCPPVREIPHRAKLQPNVNLIQFALGWNVAPEPRATVHVTARFRWRVLRNLIRTKTKTAAVAWSGAPGDVRETIAEMTGKDAEGNPLQGPRRHAEFLLWWNNGRPTRLLIWRGARPFDEDEQDAILRAAKQELSWAVGGSDAEAWKIKLVPLHTAVNPPGFDGVPARDWQSLTPYVPPRHHLRGGKVRNSETIENQIRHELIVRGYMPNAMLLSAEEIEPPSWVAVHVPRREADTRPFIGDRRGYMLRLAFDAPITGPLRLGHSSSFGLGLFTPCT